MRIVWLFLPITLLLACAEIPKAPGITKIPGDRRELGIVLTAVGFSSFEK